MKITKNWSRSTSRGKAGCVLGLQLCYVTSTNVSFCLGDTRSEKHVSLTPKGVA